MFWFYSLTQALSAEQTAILAQDFEAFLINWKSHGTPVAANIQVFYQQFVYIQADVEGNSPSGCSIDGMKKQVAAILDKHHLSYSDAAQVFYKNSEGEIQSAHFQEIKQLLKTGKITADTLVFDHSLNQTNDIHQWEKPLKETWLKRFL